MRKMKLIIIVTVCVLGAAGVALASEGRLPLLSGNDDSAAVGVGVDAYDDNAGSSEGEAEEHDNHGSDVSAVAQDKDAVGTKTLPNGKVIENHGMAVREAAHKNKDQDKDAESVEKPDDDIGAATAPGDHEDDDG